MERDQIKVRHSSDGARNVRGADNRIFYTSSFTYCKIKNKVPSELVLDAKEGEIYTVLLTL